MTNEEQQENRSLWIDIAKRLREDAQGIKDLELVLELVLELEKNARQYEQAATELMSVSSDKALNKYKRVREGSSSVN